jgi:hypothetical protein
VLDEMGVGAIHSGYANHFFPGTSVLQQRPRYLFFTCWNYLCLDRLDQSSPTARKDEAEDWVKRQLLKTNQKNVIGARVDRPAQPVDVIYWTALRTWGFYRGPDRSTLIHKWNTLQPKRVGLSLNEDAERIEEEVGATFCVKKPPPYWLRARPQPVTFDLANEEAVFLKGRLESLPSCLLSAAASNARSLPPRSDALLWEDDLVAEAASVNRESDMVERARLASSMAHVIRAMYAALVERRRNDTATRSQLALVKNVDHYRDVLYEVLDTGTVQGDIRGLDLTLLRGDLPDLGERLLALLRWVKERIARVRRSNDADRLLLDKDTMELFCSEELRRKGDRRARLPDTVVGAERRASFAENTLNVTGLDYRWRVVRTLLRDLHDGLRKAAT